MVRFVIRHMCRREELDEEIKKKQKENAFKMHNFFNKEDVKVLIHMKRIPKINSKAKRLQKYSLVILIYTNAIF